MQNEVILKIEACIKEKDKCILAIDGRAAAGKTTLANLLQEYFDGAVVATRSTDIAALSQWPLLWRDRPAGGPA